MKKRYFAAAAVLHVAAMAAMLAASQHAPRLASVVTDESMSVELDEDPLRVAENAAGAAALGPTGPGGGASMEGAPARTAAAIAPSALGTASAVSSAEAAPPADNTAPASSGDAWSLNDAMRGSGAARGPLSLDALGMGAPGLAAHSAGAGEGPRTEEEMRAARNESVRAGMRNALANTDTAMGLGPEGPLLAELERAVHASSLDLSGKVTFHCTFDAKGRLTGIRVSSCDGQNGAWEALGEAVKTALAGKESRAVIDGYASDVVVETALKLPSGAAVGDRVTAQQGTVMADLSDIGAVPRRVVHARVAWRLATPEPKGAPPGHGSRDALMQGPPQH